MSITRETPAIVIRDIEDAAELRLVERLQKDVWGCDDLDVVPLTMLVATKEVGATLIGAYHDETLVGFVYGFPGYEDGHATHHSHMLAVLPAYRNFNLGYQLKLAQRERVLAQGIARITWTFDPLQSLNAYFNFAKLGVVADAYKINFYGETTSSFLHQMGTDRLWVTWLLDSQRVRERLENQEKLTSAPDAPSLVQVGIDQTPMKNETVATAGHEVVSIEIPADINALQAERPMLAKEWREATRWALRNAIDSGFQVRDFYRISRGDHTAGMYLLTRRDEFHV